MIMLFLLLTTMEMYHNQFNFLHKFYDFLPSLTAIFVLGVGSTTSECYIGAVAPAFLMDMCVTKRMHYS